MTEPKLTSLHLRFALAFYVSSEPWMLLDEEYNSPAGREVKRWMEAQRLVDWSAKDNCTERLRVWVQEGLCAVPLPTQKWTMERFEMMMTPRQAEMIKERDTFAADLHDAAAEMRCRAKQLRTEADCFDTHADRIMRQLFAAGVIPEPKGPHNDL